MADHDNGYKLLFSHAETVADFLRGFVKEDWVQELEVPKEERENLVAALFWLEQARAPADFGKKIDELVELLRTNPDLRRSFTTWLTRVLLPSRFPGVRFPEI